MSQDSLLSLAAIAERLGIGVTAARSLCDSGEIEHHRIGPKRLYRIAPQALEEYLRRTKAKPTVKIPPTKRQRRTVAVGLDFLRSQGAHV